MDRIRQLKSRTMYIFAWLMLFFGFASMAEAGVGMLSQGVNQVSASLSGTASNKFWDRQRQLRPNACKQRDLDMVMGYSYGWSYFHTVYASVSAGYRRCGQTIIPGRLLANGTFRPDVVLVGGRNTGIGDIQFGVRTRFSGNYQDNAAWEVFTTIPTGYDNQNPSRIGRGAWGLGLGVKFSSTPEDRYLTRWGFNSNKWGWRAGAQLVYFFASKGNAVRTFATVQYAFSDTNFESTGDFMSFSVINHFGFANHGVNRTVFATPSGARGAIPAATNSDSTVLELGYSHSFTRQGNRGLTMSAHANRAIIGRATAKSTSVGVGVSYRWED